MDKSTIMHQLQLNQTKILGLGVKQLGLFGSYVKGLQSPKSDIDIYVEFDSEKENFDNFINLCFLLDEVFKGTKVEVVTKGSISPYIEPKILPTIEYVRFTA